MTVSELRAKLNKEYGAYALGWWPNALRVDAHTYAHACNYIFKQSTIPSITGNNWYMKQVAIGRHKGIMFRGVELILENSDG